MKHLLLSTCLLLAACAPNGHDEASNSSTESQMTFYGTVLNYWFCEDGNSMNLSTTKLDAGIIGFWDNCSTLIQPRGDQSQGSLYMDNVKGCLGEGPRTYNFEVYGGQMKICLNGQCQMCEN